jgi:hypothetical protein
MSCCGLVVLVNQAAETVSPPDGGGDQDSTSVGLVVDNPWRAKRQASVRSLVVVVPHVLVEDSRKLASTSDQHPVQALLPDRPHPALGERACVRRLDGRRDGLDAVGGEDVVEGAGELAVAVTNQEPRRGRALRSGRSVESSRARWTTQDPFGWRVTPARRTCRVPSSMKNKTYSVVSRTVSTVKKSTATMPAACARRNARQVTDARRGAGPSPLPRSTVRMLVADTKTPSFLSSPWTRR